ncbi:MAG: DMT family transporter [Anaerolineales bacterium]
MLGISYGIGTALTWGLGNVFIKSQVNRLSSRQLLLIRSIIGAITAVLAYFLLGGKELHPHFTILEWLSLIGIVLTGYFGSELLFLYALKDLPLSYVFPIQGSYPLIATFLAWWFFGDIVSGWVLLGAVLVLSGISIIVSEESITDGVSHPSRRWRGIFITLLSSLGWAFSAILLRYVMASQDAITTNMYVSLITAVIYFLVTPPAPAFAFAIRHPSTGVALFMAGLFGGTGISNLLFILTIEVAGVSLAAILASMAPIFTSFLAVFFLGEKLTFKLILGTILTMMGVSIIVGG